MLVEVLLVTGIKCTLPQRHFGTDDIYMRNNEEGARSLDKSSEYNVNTILGGKAGAEG